MRSRAPAPATRITRELLWVPSQSLREDPDGVAFEEAAFSTIGAIAMQGVRQAEAQFGETIVGIGLGLIGQLTVQLLRASGCRVIGVDVDPWKVELARQHGIDLALVAQRRCRRPASSRSPSGRGADAVDHHRGGAGPRSDRARRRRRARSRARRDRRRGTARRPRSPYYEKELDVRLSRSYGPGRYDRRYEEKGLDYPVGYVRWTENRNMQAFLRALETKQVSLAKLITHRVPLADVERAYDLVSGKVKEQFLGVVLQYPDGPPLPA